jgi:2-haloacid dehalogenase
MTRVPPVIAFDVNETLLDLRALDPLFERAFGDPALRAQWFAQMLQLAFVGVITGRDVDFRTAQHGALRMLAERTGTELSDAQAEEIVGTMRSLPPYPDVAPALDRLRAGGLTLCSLTNSSLEVSTAQLEQAGIADRFDAILSADQVGRLKPAPEPYRLVADTFGVPIGDVRLVAAHAWDCAGALAAGCSAAFVSRPGMVLSPVGEQPDIVGGDLGEIASLILA